MTKQRDWPAWWHWELEATGHLVRRMADRQFNEADLRAMLADAYRVSKALQSGRWIVSTRREGNEWEIVVEPDTVARRLVVITAYMVE